MRPKEIKSLIRLMQSSTDRAILDQGFEKLFEALDEPTDRTDPSQILKFLHSASCPNPSRSDLRERLESIRECAVESFAQAGRAHLDPSASANPA